MKVFPFFSILFLMLLVFFSCKDDEMESEVIKEECYVDIGDFYLLETSLLYVPYAGKNKIVFIDSLGNKVDFLINTELTSLCRTSKKISCCFWHPIRKRFTTLKRLSIFSASHHFVNVKKPRISYG